MIQAAQYPDYGQSLSYRSPRTTTSPFILAYKTKDDRFIQVCMPACLRAYYPTFISVYWSSRFSLRMLSLYTRLQEVAKNNRSPELYMILIWQQVRAKTKRQSIGLIFSPKTISHSALLKLGEEVLEDKQKLGQLTPSTTT